MATTRTEESGEAKSRWSSVEEKSKRVKEKLKGEEIKMILSFLLWMIQSIAFP